MIDTTRQQGLLPQEVLDKVRVEVVGCGAIGSHTAEALTKVGVRKLTLWDYDKVESHNLSNQGYYLPDLGKFKVEALAERLSVGTGVEVIPKNKKFEEGSRLGARVIVSAVDNMLTRKVLWDKFTGSKKAELFLDGRMAARFGQVFAVTKNPASMQQYEESLFSDEEAYQAPCTEKSTIFCAYGIASMISAQLFNYLKNREVTTQIEVCFSNMRMYQVKCAK